MSCSFSSVDIDECTDGSAQCDPASTTCNNLIPLYECTCKDGYTPIRGDRYKCKGIVNILEPDLSDGGPEHKKY